MELTAQQDKIIHAIKKIREKHHACTAQSISQVLQLSHGAVLKELVRLNDAGKVTWTNIPGSIRTTPEKKDQAPRLPADDLDTPHEAADQPPTNVSRPKKPSPKAHPTPTKKATSSKKKPTYQSDQQS